MELTVVAFPVVIVLILLGILTAVKAGFNEVVRGLEALDRASAE